MNARHASLLAAALLAAPLVHAHPEAPGTLDPHCEYTPSQWSDHDYGPPTTGAFLWTFVDGNLEDCDGDFDPTDPVCVLENAAQADVDGDADVCDAAEHDGHSEHALGGAWILACDVKCGSSDVGDGALGCFQEAAHHELFGPFSIEPAFGLSPPFIVAIDDVGSSSTPECGDGESDRFQVCTGPCRVPFGPGLDGSYQVYVGVVPGSAPFGHVVAPACVRYSGLTPIVAQLKRNQGAVGGGGGDQTEVC